MLELNPLLQGGLDALKEASSSYNRGDTISWEVIETATGSPRQSIFTRTIVQRWIVWMARERSIEVDNERNVGYRLLRDGEHITCKIKKRFRKIKTQTNLIVRAANAAEDEHLSLHERRMKIAMREIAENNRKQALLMARKADNKEGK